MSIYPSGRASPYVYFLSHKVTGEIYIGSRTTTRMKLPSHLDLPSYKTSSKYVKAMGFENFDWHIVAEFFKPEDAYDFEQQLIREHWGNELLLNRHHIIEGKRHFRNAGPPSQEVRRKLSAALKGKPKPPRTKEHHENYLVQSQPNTKLNSRLQS